MEKYIIILGLLCSIGLFCPTAFTQPNPVDNTEQWVDLCLVKDAAVKEVPEVITVQAGTITFKLKCIGQPELERDKPEELNVAGSLFFNGKR